MPEQAQPSPTHLESAAPDSTPSDLVVVKAQPFNAETPPDALLEMITPIQNFYVRSHLPQPDVDPNEWRLTIEGAGGHLRAYDLDDLRALPARTITATMECAGNDRIGLAPLPKGEPWGTGAVSTGVWRGVSLSTVLEQLGVPPSTVEVRFDGADRGKIPEVDEEMSFERSLPLATALDPDTLLAYELNGVPLPPIHGGPLRLIVPGWYGMASVKWLRRIALLDQPFDGYFQTTSYVIERPAGAGAQVEKQPVQHIWVKSKITSPLAGELLPLARQEVQGVAWSGSGAIVRVEVSVEGAGEWQPARLLGEAIPHAWRQWAWVWEPSRPRTACAARSCDRRSRQHPAGRAGVESTRLCQQCDSACDC